MVGRIGCHSKSKGVRPIVANGDETPRTNPAEIEVLIESIFSATNQKNFLSLNPY